MATLGSVKGLQCRECGELYPALALHVCEMCFGPLEVAYDYEYIGEHVSRASIAEGPASLWRYKAMLPIESDRYVDSQAGYTPLVRAENLGAALGLIWEIGRWRAVRDRHSLPLPRGEGWGEGLESPSPAGRGRGEGAWGRGGAARWTGGRRARSPSASPRSATCGRSSP